MIFFPIGCLILLLFILFLPILFLLAYFHILTFGFERLGIPSDLTILILIFILIGSTINIPLGRKKVFTKEERFFFGLFKTSRPQVQGLAINLGGAVIPVLLSFYFLFKVPLGPVLGATVLIIIISHYLARVIPGRGISLPALIPPVFSALFAIILSPNFAASTAFIAGVLGTLIGADLLNLKKVQKQGGYLSIGGAGVFDGIFLVGIAAALLAGF
jgi:uncharacterized membrane protein